MTTMFDDVKAKCPYYQKSEIKKIKCEGITSDSQLVMEFNTKKGRNSYKERFCDASYKKCPLYQKLEEKYEN